MSLIGKQVSDFNVRAYHVNSFKVQYPLLADPTHTLCKDFYEKLL